MVAESWLKATLNGMQTDKFYLKVVRQVRLKDCSQILSFGKTTLITTYSMELQVVIHTQRHCRQVLHTQVEE